VKSGTLPANAAELTEFLMSNPREWPEEVRSKAGLEAFLNTYGTTVAANDPTIQAQIKEQSASQLVEFLKAAKDGDGLGVGRGNGSAAPWASASDILAGRRPEKMGLYNKSAPGAALDKEPIAENLSAFFRTIWHNTYKDDPNVIHARQAIRNAMSERVPADGGFLVPELLRSDLLRIALETAIVRPRARIIPMETLRVPYPGVDDTSHVSNVYGGVTWNWTEEAASLSASQPSFLRVVLEAKKLTLYTEVPNELLADAIATFQQFISEAFPEALAFGEDDAFINGSGQGEPQGYLNSPCAITGGPNSNARQVSGHVNLADIAWMFPRMLPASYNRAIWVCSPGVLTDLLQLVLVASTSQGVASPTPVAPALWLSSMGGVTSIHGGPTWQLLGRPLYVTEKHPALGTTGDLAFFDPGYYLLGDRQTMQATSSEHYKFQNDLTAIRVIERVDGRTWTQSAITAKNGTDLITPVVILK
jgi:HK97 family phage major capsid protein